MYKRLEMMDLYNNSNTITSPRVSSHKYLKLKTQVILNHRTVKKHKLLSSIYDFLFQSELHNFVNLGRRL
jgi:hypothetical protein